ncbi:hypothetical protein OA90_01950 [Labrenzia sp. OB1]|nr:hypothetical protein OA90_01950 [Labrenzia sp. OB1]
MNTIRLIESQVMHIWKASGPFIQQWPRFFHIEQIRIGNAMTYLAQALGTNLMGLVHGNSPAHLARMDEALRLREIARKQNSPR